MANRTTGMSYHWFRARSDAARAEGDAVVSEALEIVEWDSHLIGAKLHRALMGQDRHQTDAFDDHPVQNDWNGSAKVALISLDRSEAAWQVIAQATGDAAAAHLAVALADLRSEVERAFPLARRFKLPVSVAELVLDHDESVAARIHDLVLTPGVRPGKR